MLPIKSNRATKVFRPLLFQEILFCRTLLYLTPAGIDNRVNTYMACALSI